MFPHTYASFLVPFSACWLVFNCAGILQDPAWGVCPLRLQPLTQQEQQRWRHTSPGCGAPSPSPACFTQLTAPTKGHASTEAWSRAQLWMSAISSPSEPGDNQQEKSSNPPFGIFCPTWRVARKKAIEWTRRYLRSTRSFSATDLLKIYFKKRKRKQITRRSAGRKQIILDIERSGACGYWLSSFPSASWMVGDVLIKLKFPYIGVQIFTSDNVRHVCMCACMYIRGERMSSFYTGWSFCFLFSVNIWQLRFKTFNIA